MKESLNTRLFGAGYAALAAAVVGLFFADKKADFNLYFAHANMDDANAVQSAIKDSIKGAFETKESDDSIPIIVNNPAAQINLTKCMSKECVPPKEAHVSVSDSWPTIAKKVMSNKINSWAIREQADVYHACMVERMNCVQDMVMP